MCIKNRLMAVFLLIGIAFIFVGCSSNEATLVEKEYEAFKETIVSEDFSGFAYILSDWKAEEEDYLSTIEDVFEKQGASLNYYNDQQADDETHKTFNEDSKKIDLYLPTNKIAYIKNGKMISELEITDHIFSNEGNDELVSFIKKNNE